MGFLHPLILLFHKGGPVAIVGGLAGGLYGGLSGHVINVTTCTGSKGSLFNVCSSSLDVGATAGHVFEFAAIGGAIGFVVGALLVAAGVLSSRAE
jgi:hypothetical protein